MLLFRAGQRHPDIWPGRLESRRKSQTAALETVQAVTLFCKGNPTVLHPGLNWYVVYFLFQASIVLGVQSLENPAETVSHIAISRIRDGLQDAMRCFVSLAAENKTSRRCIDVLNRILIASSTTNHDMSDMVSSYGLSPVSTSGTESSTTLLPSPALPEMQTLAMDGDTDPRSVPDASLNMLFEDIAQFQGLFQGVDGFSSSQEQAGFDYGNFNMYTRDWMRGYNAHPH
jgi:transcriptional regulatory protein GAL4